MSITCWKLALRLTVAGCVLSGYRASVPKGMSWHRLRYAYHEAGHAVLAHYFGRCIAVVSIDRHRVPDLVDAPAWGGCLFDVFAEADHHVCAWPTDHRNPHQITILYAGICAGVYAFDEHGWQLTHWNHSAGEDLEAVERFLDKLELTPARREHLRRRLEQLAIDLVRELWPAIVDVAQALVERGTLMGWEVHRLAERYIEKIEGDWRTEPRW